MAAPRAVPLSRAPGVRRGRAVAGAAATAGVPLLGTEEAVRALSRGVHPGSATFRSFYSSVLGGVVTDRAVMVLPIDDHMAHRGHSVFDTAAIHGGYLYELEQHLDRFYNSARLARIALLPREDVRAAVVATAAASGVREGSMRFWMSAGQGGFGLSPKECVRTNLYVVAVDRETPPEVERGWTLATSGVAIKPPFFATVKSTNYLPNALCVMDAEAAGSDQGVFIDADGFVAEGPNMNIAVLTADGKKLLVPPFENALAGLTVQRVIQLASAAAAAGALGPVEAVEFAKFTREEALGAAEVMVVGSGTLVMPVTRWDGHPIGAGAPGPVALRLREMVLDDMRTPSSDRHVAIPY